jgi:protein-S-isoprenylcysteine O-methyltransferase Ste14
VNTTRKTIASHLLVILQFTAIAIIAWPFATLDLERIQWLSISAVGLLIGLYTLAHNKLGNFDIYPEPLPDACLVTSGPYRWIRHPMYTSLLVMMLGVALFHNTWANYLGLLLLLIAVYGKIRREESHLHVRFEDYSDYVKRTHRLIPKVY